MKPTARPTHTHAKAGFMKKGTGTVFTIFFLFPITLLQAQTAFALPPPMSEQEMMDAADLVVDAQCVEIRCEGLPVETEEKVTTTYSYKGGLPNSLRIRGYTEQWTGGMQPVGGWHQEPIPEGWVGKLYLVAETDNTYTKVWWNATEQDPVASDPLPLPDCTGGTGGAGGGSGAGGASGTGGASGAGGTSGAGGSGGASGTGDAGAAGAAGGAGAAGTVAGSGGQVDAGAGGSGISGDAGTGGAVGPDTGGSGATVAAGSGAVAATGGGAEADEARTTSLESSDGNGGGGCRTAGASRPAGACRPAGFIAWLISALVLVARRRQRLVRHLNV
jgi:hypothetical protein